MTIKMIPGTDRVDLDAYDLKDLDDIVVGDILIDLRASREIAVETIENLPDVVVFNGTIQRSRGYRQIVGKAESV